MWGAAHTAVAGPAAPNQRLAKVNGEGGGIVGPLQLPHSIPAPYLFILRMFLSCFMCAPLWSSDYRVDGWVVFGGSGIFSLAKALLVAGVGNDLHNPPVLHHPTPHPSFGLGHLLRNPLYSIWLGNANFFYGHNTQVFIWKLHAGSAKEPSPATAFWIAHGPCKEREIVTQGEKYEPVGTILSSHFF